MAVGGLNEVRERVAAAADRSDRDPADIALIVVTKYASDDQVRAVYDAGVRDLAESRAGGLERRAGMLPADVRWHFVGRLQSNKARRVRPLTHLLHSLDRTSLIEAWVKGSGPVPPALVQVDIGDEPQKGGVAIGDVGSLVDEALRRGVEVRGLMAIPPAGEDARPWFARLRELRDRVAERHSGSVELSMGMSDDFEAAIAEGATMLRVGRAIFDGGGPNPS